MKKLLAVAVPALLLAACGTDSKSCSTKTADLAAGNAVGSCTVAPGSAVNIPVRLCAKCTDTSPACNAEFRNGAIEIDPIFRECQEDAGCAVSGSCENDPSRNTTNCSVSIPSGTPTGPVQVILASTARQVGTVNVGANAGCSFAAAGAFTPAP